MRVLDLHRWDLTLAEAREIQESLAARVDLRPLPGTPRLVAGADVSYDRGSDVMYAAVVLLELPDMAEVEEATASMRVRFPYVPGYLSFREAPAVLRAFAALQRRPDAVVLDGQGLAHPRRFGLACHLGLLLGLPAVGAAKSRLVGEHEEPGPARGSRAPLFLRGETVGAVVRTRGGVRPLYVSPGHLIDTEGAVELVLRCSSRYRVPEPTRRAHAAVNALRLRARGRGPGVRGRAETS